MIHAGDLDNRIKTLLDALKIPNDKELPSGAKPSGTENPFFCLLEDDSLITHIRIITDRLLVSKDEQEIIETVPGEKGSKHPGNWVYLIIRVKTMASDPRRTYIEFSL
jgi:hypothetical protein